MVGGRNQLHKEKPTMNNRQVAHVWAQQNAKHGKGNNLSFAGDTIYSYSAPIARFVKGVALVRNNFRSVTTAKHLCYVRSALTTYFSVDDLDAKPGEQFKAYKARYDSAMCNVVKARNKEKALEWLNRVADEANRFAQHFRLKSRLTIPADIPAKYAKEVEKQREQAAQQRKRQQAREALREADQVKRLQEWTDGKPVCESDFYLLPVRLRIKGDTIETSKGAQFPLSHGIRAYHLMNKVQLPWQANGQTIHLGYYVIESIDADKTIKAGCHRVEWAEVERIAKLAGAV